MCNHNFHSFSHPFFLHLWNMNIYSIKYWFSITERRLTVKRWRKRYGDGLFQRCHQTQFSNNPYKCVEQTLYFEKRTYIGRVVKDFNLMATPTKRDIRILWTKLKEPICTLKSQSIISTYKDRQLREIVDSKLMTTLKSRYIIFTDGVLILKIFTSKPKPFFSIQRSCSRINDKFPKSHLNPQKSYK